MNVDVYIYKRFDTDLLALYDAGYSISSMIKESLIAYANKKPCFFFIDEMIEFNLNDKRSVRIRFKINDANTEKLLKNIKKGFKSNFCKQILRNALIQQNLSCYINNEALLSLQTENAIYLHLDQFSNVKTASHFKTLEKRITIMDKEIKITHNKGKEIAISETKRENQLLKVEEAQTVQTTTKEEKEQAENKQPKFTTIMSNNPTTKEDIEETVNNNDLGETYYLPTNTDDTLEEIKEELNTKQEKATETKPLQDEINENKQNIDEDIPGLADDDELLNLFNGF